MPTAAACTTLGNAPAARSPGAVISAALLGTLAPLVGAQTLPNDGQTRVVAPWAAPGLTRNPVAIGLDWKGNIFVAESDRAGNAVTDTRNLAHLNAVEEDLRLRGVEDRLSLIHKWLDAGAFEPDFFTRTEDRVRVVRDTDGDGVADWSGVYAGGFNAPLDGIAAGVLWHDGSVYFTNIPSLWVLHDRDSDFVADEREALSTGYGVRWCFFGHDLHGPTLGPDGRIYFSLGDRGFNVETREGQRLVGVDRGGVFRCWPDGTGLELFYSGLRNPQDLTFDELGEFFTGDNNCDSGDRARVVHVVEGGDSGWRQDVQSLDSRGPWNREHFWELPSQASEPHRPAWVLPPLAHIGAGPSGIAYYPGLGESDAYGDHILMVDFYGSGSTLHSFRCAERGAGFEIVDHTEYYVGATVTDLAWGYDGRLYLSDWGGGWEPNPNGSLFTIANTSAHTAQAAELRELRELFTEGFAHRDTPALAALLAHRDQRVRLAAQHELARRGGAAIEALTPILSDASAPRLARIHAIWGLGQIAHTLPGAHGPLVHSLTDTDAEVRAQATRMLGDLRGAPVDVFLPLLGDESARVRFYACLAVGKAGSAGNIPALLDVLDANADADVTLRHGASYAIALLRSPDELIAAAEGRGRASRLGAVLALRRMENPGVSAYLRDPDPGVAIEAARAVYDLYIASAFPALASLLDDPLSPELAVEPLLRRAIETNVLLGDDASAMRLARFAARSDVAPEWRTLAIDRLLGWDQPLKREGVWGNWKDLPARDAEAAQRAAVTHLPAILAGVVGHADLLAKAESLQARFALDAAPDEVIAMLRSAAGSTTRRLTLLERLAQTAPDRIAEACLAGEGSPAPEDAPLRMRAREVLAHVDADAAITRLTAAATDAPLAERQHAVRLLASIDSPEVDVLFTEWAGALAGGSLDPALALDVFEGAHARADASPAHATIQPLAALDGRAPGFQTILLREGGDALRGRDIFAHHDAAQCIRCHAAADLGTGIAGPNLTTVASRLSRDRLVESVVEPGRVVAEGFGTISAMPPMAALLSPRDVRDVVAFLATLQDPALGPAPDEPPGATSPPGAGPAVAPTPGAMAPTPNTPTIPSDGQSANRFVALLLFGSLALLALLSALGVLVGRAMKR